MRKIALFTVLITLSIFSFCQDYRDDRKILFEHITNSDGLSQSTVYSIVQDTMGYMWFATRDGLNRYDGFEFKVYRDRQHDLTSGISQHIRTLFKDSKGNLWIGGNNGISKYKYELDEFQNYSLFDVSSDRYISDIEEDHSGNIWAGSFSGNIHKYDTENDKFIEYNVSQNGSKLYYINDLCSYKNELLIATDYGLYSLDSENNGVREINFYDGEPRIREILKDSLNRLWIGTEGDGLFLLDEEFKQLRNFKHSISSSNSICNNNVRSMAFDNQGNLWIGTFVGLSIYNPDSDIFQNIYPDNSRPYALSQNSVRAIFKDKEDGMWLGTFYGGINFYHPKHINFDIINDNNGDFSLNDDVISKIIEDKNGKVWIGTNDGGLNCWDREKNAISYYAHDENNPNSISSNNIKDVEFLGNRLLIGTHRSGLNYFNPDSKKNTIYTNNSSPESISDNSVYAVLKDHKSQIWVGTWGGLDKFYPDKGTFEHFYTDSRGRQLTSTQITFLFEDSQERIWIGTFDGLNIFYPEKDIFESFKHQPEDSASLSNNFINCVFEDNKKRIWIGTNNGLNIFNEIDRNFKRYTTGDGLSNNVIHGILEDDKDKYWISTNKGLSVFDQQEKTFTNYLATDGIQNTQFNSYSFCRLKDGTFLFGGIDGLTSFHPEQMDTLPFNRDVRLTSLSVNNKKINPVDDDEILTDFIGKTEKIVLKNNENTIGFSFVAINYIDNKNISYLSKLENYDDNWQSTGNMANYTKLPAGEYVFKVKAIKNDIVSETVSSINIIVLQPWYLKTWAFIVYGLILILASYFLFKISKARINTLHDLQLERLEKKKLSEINQMKLQFFTNISHEFKTPLTLILSPLEKILERSIPDEWIKSQIVLVNKNAKRLLNLVDQLLEFRKSEMGKLELKASQNNIVGFINDIYLSFASVASQNNITYTFQSEQDKQEIYFDKSVIEKIVFNLLSNAFKFTPSGGKVGVSISETAKWLSLEISDSGKGIPSEKLSLIFERYYSVDETNLNIGTGIGLALTKRLVELHHGEISVESNYGSGTRFMVKLPLLKSAYVDNELVSMSVQMGGKYDEPEMIVEERFDEKAIETLGEEKDSVLIVEDNIEIANYLRDNLSVNYKIHSAANGEEAYSQILDINPSLIISDIMMPVMDGIKLCGKIKQNIKTAHIPVILLTAKSSIKDQLEGYESGADDYVPKPFSINVLEAKVGNILKSRKRLKEFYSQTIEIQPEEIAFNPIDQEILEKAKQIVEQFLADTEFSVEVFAREIGMSRSNLHLKLKAITGESATDFIKKVRFGKALKLLEENRYSISEISYEVGFNSPSYFTTSFKKYFGYLPTEHVEKQKLKS